LDSGNLFWRPFICFSKLALSCSKFFLESLIIPIPILPFSLLEVSKFFNFSNASLTSSKIKLSLLPIPSSEVVLDSAKLLDITFFLS